MTKIQFKDLPDRSTPRNATNLNKLNNVSVGTTTPTLNEEIWVKQSKNKMNLSQVANTNVGGITTTFNKNTMTINGTTTSDATWIANTSLGVFPAGTYTFNITKKSGTITFGSRQMRLYLKDGSTNLVSVHLGDFTNSYKLTFTLTKATEIIINGYENGSGIQASNVVYELQINKGNEVLEFDNYVLSSIKVNNNGTYDKLTDTLSVGADSNNSELWVYSDNVFKNINYSQGALATDTGSEISNAKRIRSDYAEIEPNSTHKISLGSGYKYLILGYKENKSYDGIVLNAWQTGEQTYTVNSTTKFVRIVIAFNSEENITPGEEKKAIITNASVNIMVNGGYEKIYENSKKIKLVNASNTTIDNFSGVYNDTLKIANVSFTIRVNSTINSYNQLAIIQNNSGTALTLPYIGVGILINDSGGVYSSYIGNDGALVCRQNLSAGTYRGNFTFTIN